VAFNSLQNIKKQLDSFNPNDSLNEQKNEKSEKKQMNDYMNEGLKHKKDLIQIIQHKIRQNNSKKSVKIDSQYTEK
jgi:hypothetical protein